MEAVLSAEGAGRTKR